MITILTELNNGKKTINQGTHLNNKYHFQVEKLFIPSDIVNSSEWLSSDLVVFEVSNCKNVYNVKNGSEEDFKRVTYAIWINEFDKARDGLKYINKISKTEVEIDFGVNNLSELNIEMYMQDKNNNKFSFGEKPIRLTFVLTLD